MHSFYHVLSIAGFDGSGGAGIQADLKTFSALGCYGTTVLTALPVQNTCGVRSIYSISSQCVGEQLKAVLEDIPIHAIKIGMLHREEIIETIATTLNFYECPIVVDPVMVAKSGDKLLAPSAISAMKELLFPLTTILTPNLLEASELVEQPLYNLSDMEKAALELLEMGPKAVVVKGGHLNDRCDDCLATKNSPPYWFLSEKIFTHNTHGTGCTFSAAIASFLAQGASIVDAVRDAKNYLKQALIAAKHIKIGQGHGPVHHFFKYWDTQS